MASEFKPEELSIESNNIQDASSVSMSMAQEALATAQEQSIGRATTHAQRNDAGASFQVLEIPPINSIGRDAQELPRLNAANPQHSEGRLGQANAEAPSRGNRSDLQQGGRQAEPGEHQKPPINREPGDLQYQGIRRGPDRRLPNDFQKPNMKDDVTGPDPNAIDKTDKLRPLYDQKYDLRRQEEMKRGHGRDAEQVLRKLMEFRNGTLDK